MFIFFFTSLMQTQVFARDGIQVVGSSTVYPISTVVAERYGRSSGKLTPTIESTGSGGGMKLFCSGVGINHPDITNSSRRMKKSEFDTCMKNGVEEDNEVRTQHVLDFDHVNSGILKCFYSPPSMAIRFAVKQTAPCSG